MASKEKFENGAPEAADTPKKSVKKPTDNTKQASSDVKKMPEAAKKPQKKPVNHKEPEPQKDSAREEAPPSSRVIHQFMPFILGVLALLIGVFIFGDSFGGDMGIVGGFSSKVFRALFSFGAFLLPFGIIALAIFWRRIIDDRRAALKIIPSTLAFLQILMFIHAIDSRANGTFNIVNLWSSGAALEGGGLIAGLICECMLVLFKEIGTIIIVLATLLVSLMILFNVTPKNIWTYFRYKAKVASLERREKLDAQAVNTAESEDGEDGEPDPKRNPP